MAEDSRLVIPLEAATAEPYASIISYPAPDNIAVVSRIRQLRELGITGIEFGGRLTLGRLSLLGKGVSSIVLIGRVRANRIAVKIRRVDSRRNNMKQEVAMLKAANGVRVGPRYYGSTEDVIAMELIEGRNLPEWLQTLTGRGRRSRFRTVAACLLEQCLRLDEAGIDHGELSRAHKNVCVTEDELPVILDFESASMNRNSKNLTAVVQYLYLGGGFARRARRVLGSTDSDRLKRALRSYKFDRSVDTFWVVQELLKLAASSRAC